jgi:hypothetical protein
VQQIVGQLCGRQGIDEIEEEFDRGDGRRLLAESFPPLRHRHLERAIMANAGMLASQVAIRASNESARAHAKGVGIKTDLAGLVRSLA